MGLLGFFRMLNEPVTCGTLIGENRARTATLVFFDRTGDVTFDEGRNASLERSIRDVVNRGDGDRFKNHEKTFDCH